MTAIPFQSDALTDRIIWCVIEVHHTLGPGFLESVYKRALRIELRKQGLTSEIEHLVKIYYDGQEIGRHKIDLLVEGQVILEAKAVGELSAAHYAQVRSYLKATGLQRALLINFFTERVDFRRIDAR